MWLNSLIVHLMFNYKQCHFNILIFSFLFHGCNCKWWYVFNGNIGMCDLQTEAWFLHTVLQVFHSLSCNVRIKGRLSHGGKIPHSVMHVYVMFFPIYSDCPSKYMKKKCPISIIHEGAAFLWRLCLDVSIDQQNYCIDWFVVNRATLYGLSSDARHIWIKHGLRFLYWRNKTCQITLSIGCLHIYRSIVELVILIFLI